jgi:hypothetical protein
MSASVRAYFEDLGAAVDRHWQERGRRPGDLSEAAVAALGEHPPGLHVGASAVLRYAVGAHDLPTSQSSLSDPFGQPPLVLYSAADFFIQVLTWFEGTTDVHQHGFDGAFAVAEGASLHVPYRFARHGTEADGHLVSGQLIETGPPEVLVPGDVRPIAAGFGFVHALFHLERPTVTIVVRNGSSGLAFPQYSYLRSGLGFDKQWSDRVVGKRLQALAAVYRLDRTAAEADTAALVSEAPPWVGFLALRQAVARAGFNDHAASLASALARRLGPAGPLVAPGLQAEARQGKVLSRRGFLTERHHRTFLALLANLPAEGTVAGVLGSLYPGEDPAGLVLKWALELSSPAYRGLSGLRLDAAQEADLRHALVPAAGEGAADLSAALRTVAEGWGIPGLLAGAGAS